MTVNLKCNSEHYVRDQGFYTCDLQQGHEGSHEHMIKMWWDE